MATKHRKPDKWAKNDNYNLDFESDAKLHKSLSKREGTATFPCADFSVLFLAL